MYPNSLSRAFARVTNSSCPRVKPRFSRFMKNAPLLRPFFFRSLFFLSYRDRRYARADSIKLPFGSASADGRALSFQETSLASTSTAFDEARNS